MESVKPAILLCAKSVKNNSAHNAHSMQVQLMRMIFRRAVSVINFTMNLHLFVCPALSAVLTVTQPLTAQCVSRTMALEIFQAEAVSVCLGTMKQANLFVQSVRMNV